MGDRPLTVAFLWHMHQPYYKDPFTGVYRLPWVRLHGVKDYLDMLRILEAFPTVRQTFNVVPSLLEQLNEYVENNAKDVHLELTLKNPADLTEGEKTFVIENFFLANWDTMIKPFPRYYELLTKRGTRFTKKDIARVLRYFTDDDIADLQVLFNLCWIDPMFRNNDPFLKELVEKGRGYTVEEKRILIQKQLDILKQIIPEYKRMSQTGQIELSVTPFYHPILPLLSDTDVARMAMPGARLPRRFSHPEDAREQIRMGIDYFEKTFGFRPAGMWPSEGSVSEEVARMVRAEGIQWIATDEEVLARSLGKGLRNPSGYLTDAPALYRPYQFDGLSIFFRDHKLSDLIGFVYSGWNAATAADDFLNKLVQIRNILPNDRTYIVPVILDGENAWEYFSNDGYDFLSALYRALSNDTRFRTVTFSDFLKENGKGDGLSRLHAGSWINADFGIWIGHEEDNLSWDYLSKTRDDLSAFALAHPEKDLREAWKALYAAEGSDWNWWYGDDHATETQEEFDELFRSYLMKVYAIMGREIPHDFHVPILLEDRGVEPSMQIRGFIYPKIDGRVTSYYEWHQAASIDVKRTGGSMHRSEGFISSLYYGFSKDNLYLRVDPVVPFTEVQENIVIHIHILRPAVFRICCNLRRSPQTAPLYKQVSDGWTLVREIQRVAAVDIFEIEIPFTEIGAKENDEINFILEAVRNGEEAMSPQTRISGSDSVERAPGRGYVTVKVPSEDYEKIMWY